MARILVVEDDLPVRAVIRRMLKAEGHDIFEASNGEEAIEIYKNEIVDLLVLDILMPVKEGLETIKELKRDYPDVKIIAISGGGKVSPPYYLDLAMKFGAQKTFAKPFAWKKLIGTVNELLMEDDGKS